MRGTFGALRAFRTSLSVSPMYILLSMCVSFSWIIYVTNTEPESELGVEEVDNLLMVEI